MFQVWILCMSNCPTHFLFNSIGHSRKTFLFLYYVLFLFSLDSLCKWISHTYRFLVWNRSPFMGNHACRVMSESNNGILGTLKLEPGISSKALIVVLKYNQILWDRYKTVPPSSILLAWCLLGMLCIVSQYSIITRGIVQRFPFNIMAELKVWVWVSCSKYTKVHFMNVQIYGGQGTVSL